MASADLLAQHPGLKVLIVSMHQESVYAHRALRIGARGFVMKQVPPERKSVDLNLPVRELFVITLKKHKEPLVPKLEGRITVLNPPKYRPSEG